ncbi:MAG: Cyclohexa-1,5-dienecarbonyl-CoA hydratase [Planctomycetes bacterium]|nr:Cyclohexa-1,5-dienecarbonyl-CoA hydratase [Planctomycetota bacterium]
MSGAKVRSEAAHGGRSVRVVLSAGKGNVLDAEVSAALCEALVAAGCDGSIRAIALTAEGPHFSFGASVPEHVPGKAEPLLRALGDAVRAILRSPVPVVAAVRGACLGGGLEVVLPCHRVIAAPDAKLGLPEVTLGMFAPAGTALLPERVGRGLAEEMLLTGRVLSGLEAKAAGLADDTDADPDAAAAQWIERKLVPLSATAVRHAASAARHAYAARAEAEMTRLEHTFLHDTMRTPDALEGVASFLEKRAPRWAAEESRS